ncbi:MAG: glycosyltransferase family 39 protein [Bacteroidales bacterium]|nr:glycosyltransferase family 39 protein [Bacteroidales bacterium]
MKLKDYIHSSKLWVIILLTIQTIYISAFSFYNANTKYCCEIEIFSEKPCQVEFVTPIGNTYTEHIDANCKTIIPKRPLKHIKAGSNISLSCATNKVSAVDVFVFLRGRGFLLTWAFLSILCITAILINKKDIIVHKVVKPLKQKWHITKRKFYKYLLRGKTNNAKTLKIDNKSYITLIVLAALWVILAFIPYSHKQIEQNETGKWRALVSLEMKLSNNYIAPTLNGEQYCKKPPLFNYMLLPAFNSKQNAVNWMQFISTLTVLILVVCVYLVSRQMLDIHKSLFTTIIFAYSITVFYDILTIGLDSLFATLCILIFMTNIYFAKRKSYLSMFLVGYLLTALAFMTKGTPAIYFQGVSIFSIMICTKSYKHIFSWKHIVGISPFIVIVGTYCLLYSKYYNPLSWFINLFMDVSWKLEIDSFRRLTNMLSFYGKCMVSYPVLALFPILFEKHRFVKIIKSPTDSYLLLVSLLGMTPFFIGDFLTYYILMFVPLITILIIKHLDREEHTSASKIILTCGIPLFFTAIAILLGKVTIYSFIIILPFLLLLYNHKWLNLISVCIYTIIITFLVLHIKTPQKNFLVGNNSLRALVLNIKYDTNSQYADIEKQARKLTSKTSGNRLYVLPDSEINYATMYYLTYHKGEIIRVARDSVNKGDFYLTNLKLGIPLDSIPQQIHESAHDTYGETLYDSYLFLYKK